MTAFGTIEGAVVSTLHADSWLGDPNNIGSISADFREEWFSADQLAGAFTADELPAIRVTTQLTPPSETQSTTNEIDQAVGLTVVTFTSGFDRGDVRDAAQEIQDHIDQVLRNQKTSQKALGIDALVTDLSSTVEVFDVLRIFHGVGSTQAMIKIIQVLA